MKLRNKRMLKTLGYPLVAVAYPRFGQQIWEALVIRTAHLSVACSLLLSLLMPGASGQAPQDEQQPPPAATAHDAEYRKFEELETFVRNRNTKNYAITTPNGIDEASYVPIGGIEQWVTIRGEDRNNPVLLVVHGGPGDVTNPWSFAFFAPWEKYFTIVQWDQRGAGRTLRKTGREVASTMTVDRMTKDGVELAEYLTKRLGKEKIIVVAHSFGTLLGLGMVRARPDLFYAYVGTGQVANEAKNYSAAYEALLQKAQATGTQQAIDDLKRVGPPPYNSGEGYRVQRKWSNKFEGADEFLNGTIGLALVAPGITLQDINDDTDGQVLSGERLFDQSRSQGPKELGLEFSLPMFVFEGDEDFTTPTALARQYFELLKAPRKQFVPIHGGHFAMFIHSDEFLRELLKRVRPLAVGH